MSNEDNIRYNFRSKVKDPFVRIPIQLDDLSLDPYAFRVYIKIARRAGGDECFESITKMSDACMMGRKKFGEALAELVKRNIIYREDLENSRCRLTVNDHTDWLCIDELKTNSVPVTPESVGLTPCVSETHPLSPKDASPSIIGFKKIPIKKIPLNPPIVPQGDSLVSNPKPIVRKFKETTDGTKVWEAYSEAYEMAYPGVHPARNADTARHAKKIAELLPFEEAIAVARFYLTLKTDWYIQKSHDLRWLVQDLTTVRTQMLTGRKTTTSFARKADATDERKNQYERIVKKMAEEKRLKTAQLTGELI